MTDTLKRLSGTTPLVPVKAEAGTALYTPGGGVVANVKHAVVTNSQPWDAYLRLGVNALTTNANVIIPGLLVPAFKTVVVPLDIIVSNAASDVVRASQSIPYQDTYGTASELQTPAITAGVKTTGSASTAVAASWTEVSGTLYLMSVAWKLTTGAGTISSFTDTHTGISWTEIKTVTSTDGTQKLACYAAVSSGTTAATSTVNFSATQDASSLAITNVALVGTFDNTTANGVDALVYYGSGECTWSDATPYISLQGRPWSGSNRIVSSAMYGTATTHTAPTGFTELYDNTTNQTAAVAYSLGSTATATSSVYMPTWAAANGVSLAIGVEVQQRPNPLAVSLYGVEVT